MIEKEETAPTKQGTAPQSDETSDETSDDTSDQTPNESPDDRPNGEEAVAEAEAEEDETAAAGGETEAAEEPLDPVEVLTAEVAAAKEQLLRALAETENVRRRAARDREEAGKYAITAFARDLLSVADNLRRALDSAPEEVRKNEAVAGLISGIEMTEREFLSAIERHGIRRVDPLGEKFDHNLHQAVFEVADSDQPPGTVVQVVQAGYVIADRLLRPAMVGVAKEAKTEAPAAVDTEA